MNNIDEVNEVIDELRDIRNHVAELIRNLKILREKRPLGRPKNSGDPTKKHPSGKYYSAIKHLKKYKEELPNEP